MYDASFFGIGSAQQPNEKTWETQRVELSYAIEIRLAAAPHPPCPVGGAA